MGIQTHLHLLEKIITLHQDDNLHAINIYILEFSQNLLQPIQVYKNILEYNLLLQFHNHFYVIQHDYVHIKYLLSIHIQIILKYILLHLQFHHLFLFILILAILLFQYLHLYNYQLNIHTLLNFHLLLILKEFIEFLFNLFVCYLNEISPLIYNKIFIYFIKINLIIIY